MQRNSNHRIRAWKLKIRNENLFSEESQKARLPAIFRSPHHLANEPFIKIDGPCARNGRAFPSADRAALHFPVSGERSAAACAERLDDFFQAGGTRFA